MGFFKKVAGAFVQIDETDSEGGDVSVDSLNAEAADLLAAIEAGAHADPGTAVAPARPAPPPPPPTGGLETGLPYETVYARAGIPSSPYTAEMLLRVVEGLKALPPAQALAAVEAMDAADDRWKVGDVLLDAERKIEALAAVRLTMQDHVRGAEQLAERTTTAIDQHMAATEAEIAKSIAELEALRAEAHQTATTERAAVLSELEATRQSCTLEAERVATEIARLSQVEDFLGKPEPR